MVKGRATPDDPDLAGYWRYRRDKHGTPLDGTTANLLARQHGYCPTAGTGSSTQLVASACQQTGRQRDQNLTRTR